MSVYNVYFVTFPQYPPPPPTHSHAGLLTQSLELSAAGPVIDGVSSILAK